MKKLALLFVLGFLLFASGVVSANGIGDVDEECTDNGFDFGIERFECDSTSPDTDDPSYDIGVSWDGCDYVAWGSDPGVGGVLSKEDNLPQFIYSGGTSGDFGKTYEYDISHITFCGYYDWEEEGPTCELTVDNPYEGQWFDSEAVPVQWHLSEGCTPIDHFWLYYKKGGDCSDLDHGWFSLTDGSNAAFGDNPYEWLWDRPATSDQYCVKVKVTSNGARDAAGPFNVDLAKPEVSLDVGDEWEGYCEDDTEEENGVCYVNTDTEIGLNCEEITDDAWQSGVDYTEYRYSLDGGLTWTTWAEASSFSFPEDSNHLLQYRCFDNVGKVDSEEKEFVVESQAPILSKEVFEPKVSGCDVEHPSESTCDWYVTTNTKICLSAYDPEPHPVGGVEISCEATRWWTLDSEPENVNWEVELDEDGCFTYGKDSYHELHCWATDALGNRNEEEDLYEADIVDSAAPYTWFEILGPSYGEFPMWMDGVSRVELSARDSEPHPVGVESTYFRNELVNDNYCWGEYSEQEWDTTSKEDESWMLYQEPFGMEESCHVVEYYSVDRLGNEEDVKFFFVFVDKTPPVTVKEVGEPNYNCENDFFGKCEEGWDWMIPMYTPITMSCEDQEPHPSGVQYLCYSVTLDGELQDDPYQYWYYNYDWEGSFWDEETNAWCVPVDDEQEITIEFQETSEHRLDFYCVDNVDKTSEVDSELFKVNGEVEEIPIYKKWNLISVPFDLLNEDIEEVFSQLEEDGTYVTEVWTYDEDGWHVYNSDSELPSDLETIEPGYGYWVHADCETDDEDEWCGDLEVGGALLSAGPEVPPTRELQAGWNLIGRYGVGEEQAGCALFSLVDTTIGYPRWSSLWRYNAEGTGDWFEGLNPWDWTNHGEGYWVEMDVEDLYSPATNCWSFWD